jgi:LysR family transcriptional regulator, glycine cleavage system transcriptional activator
MPPLNGLRAFEASARHLSFKRAADELRVTPGAVSQQVKALEASIGVKLFRRLPRGLLLTAAGEDYLPSISDAFHAISEATEKVAPALKGRQLLLAISPSLREDGHPVIEHLKGRQLVRATLFTDDLRQLFDGKVDAFLRLSLQAPPGLHADHIELPSPSHPNLTAMLLTQPGFAGCREHRALVKLLRRA